jgi:hypothetical protein
MNNGFVLSEKNTASGFVCTTHDRGHDNVGRDPTAALPPSKLDTHCLRFVPGILQYHSREI